MFHILFRKLGFMYSDPSPSTVSLFVFTSFCFTYLLRRKNNLLQKAKKKKAVPTCRRFSYSFSILKAPHSKHNKELGVLL